MKRFWSLVRRSPAFVKIIVYLLGVILLAAPVVLPLYFWEYATTAGQTVIGTPIALFAIFLMCLPVWMRRVHACGRPWQVLGLQGGGHWWRGWGMAFVAGIVGVALLYGLQLLLGWAIWVPPDSAVGCYVFEGLLVGFGVGLAEELIFRGWLLYELEQDFTPTIALWGNAIVFAIAHYLRPLSAILATWPQFVGLVLLGAALVWARRIPWRRDRRRSPITTLGPAAGLHGGLVFAYYQVDVNDLVLSTERVPEWMTGIGGNPLAGLLGVGFLMVISGITYAASHRHQRV